jgi:hypothetical protein
VRHCGVRATRRIFSRLALEARERSGAERLRLQGLGGSLYTSSSWDVAALLLFFLSAMVARRRRGVVWSGVCLVERTFGAQGDCGTCSNTQENGKISHDSTLHMISCYHI